MWGFRNKEKGTLMRNIVTKELITVPTEEQAEEVLTRMGQLMGADQRDTYEVSEVTEKEGETECRG